MSFLPSKRRILPLLLLFVFIGAAISATGWGATFPLTVTDAAGRQVRFSEQPQRVVCLAPDITEMIVRFGRESVLTGLTRQDLISNSGLRTTDVGDYFKLDITAVSECRPDLVIAAPSHHEIIDFCNANNIKFMVMEAGTLAEGFSHMAMIGRLFDCEEKATEMIQRNKDEISLARKKAAGVPESDRKRVARVMVGETLSCPGDDSFQNETIVAAGGIPPRWGKTGFAVPVDIESWQRFNPQFVYGCNMNQRAVSSFIKQDGWKVVDAVRNRSIAMFPCELTCRVSTHVGEFVQYLSATLYPDIYADPDRAILENTVLKKQPLQLDQNYIKNAGIVIHRVADAEFKTVVVAFKQPMKVISTLEGARTEIQAVGNTYVPMHASMGHMARGIERVQKDIAANLGFDAATYAGLMTGANMDNLSVQEKTFRDLKVTALVTAGVRGNALRVAAEMDRSHKLGTINIIVMTNRKLAPEAMAWAPVVITEAKSAALLDLDIRSTHTPWIHRATGTGTDTMVVVEGEGPVAPYSGGHTRIGQLIAHAVYDGVIEAISRQNGIKKGRGLFQRLNERKLRVDDLVKWYGNGMDPADFTARIASLLHDPYYAGFVESALAISDEYRKGLIKDLSSFDTMCTEVTARLAGGKTIAPRDVSDIPLPRVIAKAFGALSDGIVAELSGREHP